MRRRPQAQHSIAFVGLAVLALSTGALTATAATIDTDTSVVAVSAEPSPPVGEATNETGTPVVDVSVEPAAPEVDVPAEPELLVVDATLEPTGSIIAASDHTGPSAPEITSPVNDARFTATTISVSGSLVDSINQEITVWVDDDGSITEGCSVTVEYFDSTFTCDAVVPGPGKYELTATSVDLADPDLVPSAVSDAVTVIVGSTAPSVITNFVEYDNVWTTRSPMLTGTGPVFGSVLVEVTYNDFEDELGEQTVEYCSIDEVPRSGIWSCVGTPPPVWGYTYFSATGLDVLSNPTANVFEDTIGGEMLPAPPSATYVFGPRSFEVTLQGMPDWNVFADIISVDITEGEGYFYGFTDEYCPLFSETPLPGGESETCFYGDLEPGIWNVYAMQEAGFITGLYRDDYIMIPDAPTGFNAAVNPNRSVTFSGVGSETGYTVIVRGPGDNAVCSGVVAAGGGWQCTASPPAGTASYRAIQQATGFIATPPDDYGALSSYAGFSDYTAPVSVTVPPAPPAPPPPPAPQPPVVTPSPLPWVLAGYDGSPLTPGQQLSLSATGLPVGTNVVVEIRSTPQVLGSTVVGDTGAFALDVVVPEDLEPGEHTLVAIATPPGGVESPVAIPVTVVAAEQPIDAAPSVEEPETVAEPDEGASGAGGAGGVGDRSQPATPSAISDSIPTIERIFTSPLTIIVSGGLALAILLLVAFPAELLNSTLASNTRRLGRWYAAIESGVERATDWFSSVTRTRAAAAAVLVVVTSLIFGFVDPEYGFDPVSVRMTVSLAIGLFIVTYVSSWISGVIIRRVWNIETRVSLQPAALVFAVIGVIVARILEFSPGFLIGLVIGLDIVTRVGAPHRVRAILTNIGVIVGLALVSWVGFSVASAVMTGEPTVVGLLISDALVATTAEGLTAALAAMLPLGFLNGHEVFRRSKLLWAGSFAAVATVFALIVLPTAAGETGDVADVGFWMLVMVVFAAVTLTLWALLHFTNRGDSDDDELVEQPAATSR